MSSDDQDERPKSSGLFVTQENHDELDASSEEDDAVVNKKYGIMWEEEKLGVREGIGSWEEEKGLTLQESSGRGEDEDELELQDRISDEVGGSRVAWSLGDEEVDLQSGRPGSSEEDEELEPRKEMSGHGSGRRRRARQREDNDTDLQSELDDVRSQEDDEMDFQDAQGPILSDGSKYSLDNDDQSGRLSSSGAGESVAESAAESEEGRRTRHKIVSEDSNMSDGSRGKKRKVRSDDTSSFSGNVVVASGVVEARPLKKTKGPFNRAYLDLLNGDIEDAASQYVPLRPDLYDERIGLPQSQIGMTIWTPAEKERFFEALGRLGRDNASGIAGRIRTKGEMEVRQYLKILHDALILRRQQNELDPLELADFPTAAELSHNCCEALEQAADSIAVRQEHYEDSVEKHKCARGQDWLITKENCEELTVDDDGGLIKKNGSASQAMTLFDIPKWLQLSERVFMNGAPEGENWQSVAGEPPSIRTTAIDDFYSLTVSLTKRLMAASMYMAESRIRSKRAVKPSMRNFVRRRDVEAAAASLGLDWESRSAQWTGCARRLGLHVYEDPASANAAQREPMPYEAVEDALADPDDHRTSSHSRELASMLLLSDHSDDSISSDSSMDRNDEEDYEEKESESQKSSEEDSWDDEVKNEADEVILHSAPADQPQTTRQRRALMRRIKAEREREKRAEAIDAQTTYREETQMWALLGRQPLEPLVEPESPESGRRDKITVDAMYSAGRDWRSNLKYVSEWETTLLARK